MWWYLKVVDVDFGYWVINIRKLFGSMESYFIVEFDWKIVVRDY